MPLLGKAPTWSASLALCYALCAQAVAQPVGASTPAVELAPPPGPLDPGVRQLVLQELKTDGFLVASGIDATVRSGIVELTGSVPVLPWKQRAARVAGVVRGVRAVVNRIRVVPERKPDVVVQKDVLRALRGTAALAHTTINARVENGVVVLTGSISTWEQQQLAERMASGVVGVRFCQNQLTSSGSVKRTPAIIAADVQGRLARDPLVRRAPIRVSVRAHRVMLVGRIGSRAERKRAVALAWVKGVNAVDAGALVVDTTNRPNANLRVTAPTDEEMATTIRDLIPYWPSVAASTFSTSVVGGVVTLHGTVQTFAEKQALEEMARSTVGVAEIKSELRGPWWRPTPPIPQVQPTRRRTPPARKR